MTEAIRTLLKLFGLPVFIGLWIIGWSLYSTGDNAQALLKPVEKKAINNKGNKK